MSVVLVVSKTVSPMGEHRGYRMRLVYSNTAGLKGSVSCRPPYLVAEGSDSTHYPTPREVKTFRARHSI